MQRNATDTRIATTAKALRTFLGLALVVVVVVVSIAP